MRKEKFWLLVSRCFAFIAPMILAIEIASAPDTMVVNLLCLVIPILLIGVAFSFIGMRRENESKVLKSLMLGSGLSFMIIPGYPGIKVLPIIIWLVIFLGISGGVLSRKLENGGSIAVSDVLRLLIITFPFLGIVYYFASSDIWFMLIASLFIFASQQKKDLRDSPASRYKCMQLSLALILVGLSSLVFQYLHLGLNWTKELIINLGHEVVVFGGFGALVLLTIAFAFFFHKKDEKEKALLEEKRLAEEEELRKQERAKEQALIDNIISGNFQIKYEDYLVVSNIKMQIVYGKKTKDLIRALYSILRFRFNDDELKKAETILRGMLAFIEDSKQHKKVVYKGEGYLKLEINEALKFIPEPGKA